MAMELCLDITGRTMKKIIVLFALSSLFSCAALYHVQLGDIHSSSNYVMTPFDIKISETGFSLQEAKNIGKALTQSPETKKQMDDIAGFIGLFQMGPKTGKPVYVPNYATNLMKMIYEKCPSGKVTGLLSVRESREYPVVSGEIVKVTGYCLTPKGGS